MTIQEILASVNDQFADLAAGWRPEASLKWLQTRHTCLRRDLRRHYDLLVSQRAVIQGLHHRLDMGERRAADLSERAQLYLQLNDGDNAWKSALELDRLRGALEREREQLICHQQNYAEQRRAIDALKRAMANLRERMERRTGE